MRGEISKETIREALAKLPNVVRKGGFIGIDIKGATVGNNRPWRRSKRTAWGQEQAHALRKKGPR